MLQTLADIARILQFLVSLALLAGIAIAYWSWKSKQNLDRRNLAISYSLTKNRQYFDARGEIAIRFKHNLRSMTPLTPTEVDTLKQNNDKILADVRFVLSHWEIMAISIFDKIIDEKTCFEMVGSTLVNTLKVLETYIRDARKEEQHRRRYDYLMILYEDWKVRLEKSGARGPISRYDQYIQLGKDRSNFERKLASDLAEW